MSSLRDASRLRERLTTRTHVVLAVFAIGVAVAASRVPLWRARAAAARLSDAAPDRIVPYPLSVLPPPDAEYAGVWAVPPETARRRLIDEHGFSQQLRAYLHAYEHGGETVYEAASCAYRPNGFTGEWQLHVRLFGTPDGETDVWCHWERNPNVAPFAHLRQDGYDPAEGIRRFRELVPAETRIEGPIAEQVRESE
ncbi:hypothetical protein [Halorubrum tibetense]|uniref:Polyketide cyclase n=1 Tax=Halorubrum tibetense TaxID=175631 RepID=A0ABD5S8L0_9EURY